jgi:hypothetical protein
MASTRKVWTGTPPERCNLCEHKLEGIFIDGRTKRGAWAYMCVRCHELSGVGLGTGNGQAYQKRADGKFEKLGD